MIDLDQYEPEPPPPDPRRCPDCGGPWDLSSEVECGRCRLHMDDLVAAVAFLARLETGRR